MTRQMRIVLCQTNPTVGDLAGNLKMMQDRISQACSENQDVIVFPELVTVGYPPRDLLYSDQLWTSHDRMVEKLHQFVRRAGCRITVIFGGLHRASLSHGRTAKYNAAYIMDVDGIRHVHKRLLPTYDIFNEHRYFDSGLGDPYLPIPITYGAEDDLQTVYADVLICEDMWNFRNRDSNGLLPASYTEDPVSELRGDGPLFILNGSPYWMEKFQKTKDQVESISRELQRPVIWTNQIGAHDDIVTAGYSMVCLPTGSRVNTRIAKMFAEDMMAVTIGGGGNGITDHLFQGRNDLTECPIWYDGYSYGDVPRLFGVPVEATDLQAWFIWKSMCLHLADYCRRCGFTKVVIGQSGGIDSAIVAAVAALTLGPKNVISVTMPSKHSSDGSVSDSEQLVKNLRISDFRNIPIGDLHQAVRASFLSGGRQEFDRGLTDENIQPRCRMITLMVISSEENALLLTTGNKSEVALGYTTLYGDLAGGLSIISDVYKTMVHKICIMLNKYHNGELIPQNTIEKPPSAELAPNQCDTDSLPPYHLLDPTLDDILNGMSLDDIKLRSAIPGQVDEIIRKIDASEFKRKQAPVSGAKLTMRAFGSGRLIPVAKRVRYV